MIEKIKRILEPAFANKKEFLQSITVWFLASVYSLWNIYLIQKIVWIIESQNINEALNVAIFFAIFNLLCILVLYLMRDWRWINIDNAVQKWVQRKYMKKFDKLDNTIIESFWTWKIISIVNKWISYWPVFILDWNRAIVSFLVSVVALGFIIFEIWNLYHILILLLILVFVNIIVILITKKSIPYRKEIVERRIFYDRQFVKMVMNKFEILQNWKIEKEISILDKEYQSMTDIRKNFIWKYVMWMNTIPDIFVFLVYFTFLLLFIYTSVSFSLILSFFLLINFFNSMLRELIWFYDYYTREFYNVEKLWDFFDTTPEIRWLKDWEDFKFKIWDIEISNLSFSYWDTVVFENFSAKIQWWKITALVWESWWWKTTLMKLLSGFINADLWNIFIDWQNLKEINLLSYYKKIWYLTQEPSVFDWTIMENLTYWATEKVSEKKLKEIIKLAKCEFIFDFKDWLETEIWERWVRLSWWQKQRLAIAKIFIKDPDIIFLDEPTSALDSMSEKLIQESFANLFKWRTVIIVAHRLQTVKNADEIFVIEHGEVIEKWTHNSLVRKWWHYKEMLDLQSGF